MTKSTRMHLENITVDGMISWRKDTFVSYASSSGQNGSFAIGVNGFGNYVVIKDNKEKTIFHTAEKAIEYYSNLLTKDETP